MITTRVGTVPASCGIEQIWDWADSTGRCNTPSMEVSDGIVGDAYDNADVEELTIGWREWHNNQHLHSTLGYLPPAEYEANYYAEIAGPLKERSLQQNCDMKTGTVQCAGNPFCFPFSQLLTVGKRI